MRLRTFVPVLTVFTACQLGVAASVQAQDSLFDRLSIHGYLTQAYGQASDHPIYGIPTEGTADLRTAALQLRYAISPKDNFVVQARNRRLGESILSEIEEDVQLQWAFYQRRMGNLAVRVGKVPLPMGFYSELRNVGTILPFYRAPAVIYPDGVETFDGVNVSYELPVGGWSVEAATNVGSFSMVIPMAGESGAVEAHMSRGDIKYAGTLTVNTPVAGLRFRGTLNKFGQPSWFVPGQRDYVTVKLGSLDGSFTRFNVRGEYGRLDITGGTVIDLAYVQAGVKLHPRIAVNSQYEVSKMEFEVPGIGRLEQTNLEDFAVGANYSISHNVVFKLEGHRAKGFSFDGQAMGSPMQQGDYVLTSLSVSF